MCIITNKSYLQEENQKGFEKANFTVKIPLNIKQEKKEK